MDVSGYGTDAGTPVQIWSCHGGINQQFTWLPSGLIQVYGGTMCVDAYTGAGNNGDPIVIWQCHGGPNQQWTATAAGEIQGINGKCIDVRDVNPNDGARLQLWDCSGTANQKWDSNDTSSIVYPGQSIQGAVDGNPAGTQFVIKAGTHVRQSVVPKAGDKFVGEPGTVLDGQGAPRYAFYAWNPGGWWVNDVTIRGLKVTNYASVVQDGAISASAGPGQSSSGWVVDSCEVSYNAGGGIHVGTRMQVLNSNVHHNRQLGIGGSGDNILVQGTEIAFNNYLNEIEPEFEAGGTKWSATRNLIVRNNYVHDNHGPGLWTDTDNIDALYEGNRVEDNESDGIIHEISYAAVIRNNTIKRNGLVRGHWAYGAGITVALSPDVEIYGNVVDDNYHGISAIQQNPTGRGPAPYGPYLVQNLYVHDNTVTQTRSFGGGEAAGLSDDTGDPAVFTSRNNRFANNTYYLGALTLPFAWMGRTQDVGQWQGYSQDQGGSFFR